MKSLLCLLLLFSGWAHADALTDDENAIGSVSQVVGQLIVPDIFGYYGSALIYDADESHLYLLTNDHTVPDRRHRADWQFKSVFTEWKPVPVTLVGRAPGYDVAVLAIDRAGTSVDVKLHPLNTVENTIHNFFFSSLEFTAPNVGKRAVLLGAPRYFEAFNGISAQGRHWVEEMKWLAQNAGKSIYDTHAKFSEPLPLSEAHVCPPPFLDQCYLLRMRSWGFSGGGLAIAARTLEKSVAGGVAGMISHYSPLADETYAIPIPTAKRVAERLRARALREGNGVVETEDEAHRYRILPDGRVTILQGPLAGKTIGRATNEAAGGGEIQPGGEPRGGGGLIQPGGEPRGGGGLIQPGGEPRGGGGDAYQKQLEKDIDAGKSFLIFPEEGGTTSFIGSWFWFWFSSTRPENWGRPGDLFSTYASSILPFKGTSSVFDYDAGVPMSEGFESPRLVYGVGQLATVNASNFLRSYEQQPSGDLVTSPVAEPIPNDLVTRAGDVDLGLHTSGRLRRWKSDGKMLRKQLGDKVKSTSGYDLEELRVVLLNMSSDSDQDTPYADLVTHRESNARFSAITRADFHHASDFQSLYLTDSNEGEVKIWYSGPLRQKGNFHYEARGMFTISGRNIDLEYGVLSLEWEFRFQRWEVKLMLAGVLNKLFVMPDPYFTDDELLLDAFFVPMQAAPKQY